MLDACITIRVTDEELKYIQEIASEEDRSVGYVVRRMIRSVLDKETSS